VALTSECDSIDFERPDTKIASSHTGSEIGVLVLQCSFMLMPSTCNLISCIIYSSTRMYDTDNMYRGVNENNIL